MPQDRNRGQNRDNNNGNRKEFCHDFFVFEPVTVGSRILIELNYVNLAERLDRARFILLNVENGG